MLKIKQLQMKIELDTQMCSLLVDDLQGTFNFLMYSIKKDYLQKLNLLIKDEYSYIKETLFPAKEKIICGDLVFLEPDTIMYYKVKDSRDGIEIGIIGDTNKGEFKIFAQHIKASLDAFMDGCTGDWMPVKKLDPSVQVLLDKCRNITPDEREIDAAKELSDPKILMMMKLLNQQDSVFQDTLVENLQVESVDKEIRRFEELELVTTDFALLCNKSGQQILRVPDRTALDDISKKGFRCFICGSSIADEKLVKAITISDFGKEILRDDRWFLILTLYALKNIGIQYSDMYVTRDQADDNKIFLDINDEAMIIQLVNRKLALDDAYLINANVAAYQLNYLTIVTVDVLSRLMKSHLRETNAKCQVDFIEGIESLKENLNAVFQDKERARIIEILKDMSSLTPVPMEELILRKVFPEGKTEPITGLLEQEYQPDSGYDASLSSDEVELQDSGNSVMETENEVLDETAEYQDQDDQLVDYYPSDELELEEGDVEDEIILGSDEDPLMDLKEV